MVSTTAPRAMGRPKSEDKRAAIIDAARRLFTANAYDSVTMDQVASAAGVAKMTVYGHFHDKESLFEAISRSVSEAMTAALPAAPCHDGDLEEELVAFGCVFLGIAFSPQVVNAMRNNFDMLSRNRALAERFYNAGPGRTRAMLAAYMKSATGWADNSHNPSEQAATDLMSLWTSDTQQQVALRLTDPIAPAEIAQHVRRCTRLILHAYGLRVAGGTLTGPP